MEIVIVSLWSGIGIFLCFDQFLYKNLNRFSNLSLYAINLLFLITKKIKKERNKENKIKNKKEGEREKKKKKEEEEDSTNSNIKHSPFWKN